MRVLRLVARGLLLCVVVVIGLPMILLAQLLRPFQRPARISADEVARVLRGFADGSGGELDMDDLGSIPLADPRLQSIVKAADATLDPDEILTLARQADAIARADRDALAAFARRVLAGEAADATDLDAALPPSTSLPPTERALHEALSHWADDGDIRARDHAYATRQREQIADRLARLQAGARGGEPLPPGSC